MTGSSATEDMQPPQREPKTYMAYKHCLELFSSNCAKRFVLDVKREDVLAFIRKLYELGCSPRTAYNRAVIVSQLLKKQWHYKVAQQSGLTRIRGADSPNLRAGRDSISPERLS